MKVQLLTLLELYGAGPLGSAVAEALRRDTVDVAAVSVLLRQQRDQGRPRARPDLSRYPEAGQLEIRRRDLEVYDKLALRGQKGDRSDE